MQGWINLDLSYAEDMIFLATVYNVMPGANDEVTEVVDLMTDYIQGRRDLNESFTTFQASWLDDSHFVLYTVFRNSSSQAYIYEYAGDQWGILNQRLDEVTDAFPTVIIGDSRALGNLTAEFQQFYSEDVHIYVIGTPNIDILLDEPLHFGWYAPPFITETQLNYLQGGLGLLNFAYVVFFNQWWGKDTVFDVTLVLEATVGVA